MPDDLLVIRNLNGGYGRIPILFDIDLTVRDGEFVGLLGHNGMGKSTLLKAIAGHLADISGTIEFRGRPMARDKADRRARAGLAYVPQGRQIFPGLTVLENLRMGAVALPAGEVAGKIDEVLEELPRLRSILDRQGGVLSGGEQQILALARALCGSPRLLLLDEPTEGIQPSIVDEIRALLTRLSTRGNLAIILVEQNLHFLRQAARRIHVLRKGRLSKEIPSDGLDLHAGLDDVEDPEEIEIGGSSLRRDGGEADARMAHQ